jgi:hypothetical protein
MNWKPTTLVAAGMLSLCAARLAARRCKARSWDVVRTALNKSGYEPESDGLRFRVCLCPLLPSYLIYCGSYSAAYGWQLVG